MADSKQEHRESLAASLRVFRCLGVAVPEHTHRGLVRYIVDHAPVGDFLTAVLSNDLREAVYRADDKNVPALPAFVGFLYNHAPRDCWGSPGAVKRWLAKREEANNGT